MKPLVWVATTLDDLRDLPPDARKEAGYQLFIDLAAERFWRLLKWRKEKA